MTAMKKLAMAMLVGLPVAAQAGRIDLALTLNGAVEIQYSQAVSSAGYRSKKTVNGSGGEVAGYVLSTGEVRSDLTVFGTQPALATGKVVSTPSLVLTPPAGAAFAGGKLILYANVDAEITTSGTIDASMAVDASTAKWSASGSNSRQIGSQPGPDQVEFDVTLDLPASLDSAEAIDVDPMLTIASSTSIPGGATQGAEVNVKAAKIVAFAVVNAAAVQVTGFTMTGPGRTTIAERAAPPPSLPLAVEYYNATLAHYFITSSADEIAKLDAGIIKGWQRTGESFKVYATQGDRAAVCRFFSTAFGDKSSHFYAPRGLGCEAVLQNPAWVFEGDVFYTYLPANGECPAGNVPVYRLYNDGQGGAPNHRFTTSEYTRNAMMAEGWIPEGSGAMGVGFCSPQ